MDTTRSEHESPKDKADCGLTFVFRRFQPESSLMPEQLFTIQRSFLIRIDAPTSILTLPTLHPFCCCTPIQTIVHCIFAALIFRPRFGCSFSLLLLRQSGRRSRRNWSRARICWRRDLLKPEDGREKCFRVRRRPHR